MLAGIRSRLTYANVISTLCLFLLLGGGAYAAFHLPKDSVKSKHIVNGQVKPADLSSPEAFQDAGLLAIGPFSQCDIDDDAWASVEQGGGGTVGYYRDRDGFVHLTGEATACGTVPSLIFTLPPGYRPAAGSEYFPVLKYPNAVEHVEARMTGELYAFGAYQNHENLELGTVEFRCGPSGQDGCP